MATRDNVLTKLHDLLLYIIPQLGKFSRDQKSLVADRIETRLLDVQGNGGGCLQGFDFRHSNCTDFLCSFRGVEFERCLRHRKRPDL